jgi:hypothetical protein
VGVLAFVFWHRLAIDAPPDDWLFNDSRIPAALMMGAWVGGNKLGGALA